MENNEKVYIQQFNVSTNSGRKRMKLLESALAAAGVFYYEEPGNTTSNRAVYVKVDNLGLASRVWGKLLAAERERFRP